MKYEWNKAEKNLYGAKKTPALVTVPSQSYIMLKGTGNPNDQAFSQKVSALYALAYGIKMGYKAAAGEADAVRDFSVYPLEGVWQGGVTDSTLVKELLEYTIMIKQPDFITGEMVTCALEKVKKKKPSPLLDEISFDRLDEALCVQVLHVGSYDDEPASFQLLDAFAAENGLKRIHPWHREIYLNNAGRVPASKLKTILRYEIARERPVS